MVRRYGVRNLQCSGCAARIEDELTKLPGVELASIDTNAARLRLEGEPAALENLKAFSRIADSIEPGAYFVTLDENGQPAGADITEPAGLKGWLQTERAQLAISAGLFTVGLVREYVYGGVDSMWGMLLLFGLPYVVCGGPVLIKGAKSLRAGDFFNEFTLMGVATLAAMAIGELPEAVGVMLFYRIGEAVQERAAGRSRRSISALLAARPNIAHVLEEGGIRDMDPATLPLGVRILVKPGEKIPLDGTVLEGSSQVDTSPLTGEPVPVFVQAQSRVFAGTINKDAALTVEVTALFSDSSVSRILELVERAMAAKAPTERFITRFARYYTPVVVLGAALVALLPPLFGQGNFEEWLYRALVLLVISCPCALVISIPLGYFGGIGAASRRGILIKGGQVLDALRHVKIVAMDKTGTLTRGVFEVSRLLPVAGVSESQLLATAALAESRSTHPLARSILQAASPLSSAIPEGTFEVTEHPGKGLIATVSGRRILAGNASLLADNGLTVPAVDTPGTVVHVAEGGNYIGALVVSDVEREDTRAAIEGLRAAGVERLVMLTGDRAEAAEPFARSLGLDDWRAGLLPEGKAEALRSLGDAKTILFVGDGINDAPVLAAAGVGVAMGGLGSEAAIEVADAVILDDSPARLPELLHIAARTRRIVWQNIILAMGVKGLVMALGIAGVSGLWEAVFADVGVALLAVLNSTRVMK